jgi:hypothetical protein
VTDFEQRLAALPGMLPAQLRALWRDVWRRTAPGIGPDLLRRGIAWKLQSQLHGELPVHIRREIDSALTRLRRGDPVTSARLLFRPGSRLVREWQGRTFQVVVLDRGFEYDGRQYRSLTQVAHAITGTHQSGLAFFGLLPRRAPTRKPAT